MPAEITQLKIVQAPVVFAKNMKVSIECSYLQYIYHINWNKQ